MKFKKNSISEFFILLFCCTLALGYIGYSVKVIIASKERDVRVLMNEATININSITQDYTHHLAILNSRAEELLKDTRSDLPEIRTRLRDVPGKGWELIPDSSQNYTLVGRLTGTGNKEQLTVEQLREIAMAEKLNRLFAVTNRNFPKAPFIYYLSGSGFWNLTPRHLEDFSFYISDYQNYELFTLGLPKYNPERKVFWTKPYLDVGGKGIMVTAGIPLYHNNLFKGTICIDMLFGDIADYLKSNIYSDLNISVIDNYNQVVSSSIQQVQRSDSIPTLQELLNDADARIENASLNTFLWNNGNWSYASGIATTNWRVFFFEKRKDFLFEIVVKVFPRVVLALLALCIIYLLLYVNRLRIENEAAKIKAEKANAAKNKLLSIISHDLRGPFLGLLGFADLMKDSVLTNDTRTQKEYLGYLHEGINKVYKLLDNLLIWAQLQKEGFYYQPAEFQLRLLATEIIESLSQVAGSKAIAIVNDIPKDLLIHSDKNMLNIIIRNLISNAVKFTPRGGTISIGAVIKGNYAEVAVTDNGIGMPAETLQLLFDTGVKKSETGTEGESGFGLGLQLCKELVDLLKGKIWVESTEGKGSTFYFTIPV